MFWNFKIDYRLNNLWNIEHCSRYLFIIYVVMCIKHYGHVLKYETLWPLLEHITLTLYIDLYFIVAQVTAVIFSKFSSNDESTTCKKFNFCTTFTTKSIKQTKDRKILFKFSETVRQISTNYFVWKYCIQFIRIKEVIWNQVKTTSRLY